MYLEADYLPGKKVAPKKNPESHRGKKVVPNEERQLRQKKKKKKKGSLAKEKKSRQNKKEQSRQEKKSAKKRQNQPTRAEKNIAPRKKILAHLYVCGTNICVLIWASKDLIYALKSKVGKCLVFY